MANIHLTMATLDYDHVRDLASGEVRAPGIDLTCFNLGVEEIFYRFLRNQEWDISEVSMGMSTSAIAQGGAPFVLIPVFPSRVFRLSSIFVRADGPVKTPQDLRGKRIGIPEWGQTAAIYSRGWLAHDVGIPLAEVDWVRSGVNQPGREETAKLALPDGINLTADSERSLTDLLLDGDIDALFTAHTPNAFLAGNPGLVRLIADYRTAEEEYFARTGIFPIMHTIAIRRAVYEEHPWVAMNLYQAFEEAKARSVFRLKDVTASRVAVPWGFDNTDRMGDLLFGPDTDAKGEYWPYGVDGSRTTLAAFLDYCHEQGLHPNKLKPEDLFAPEAMMFHKE